MTTVGRKQLLMLHQAGLVCGVTQTSGTVGVLTKVKIGTGIGLIS